MKKITQIVLIILLFLISGFAVACSPAPSWPPSPKENFQNHDVVFVGEILKAEENKDEFQFNIAFDVKKKYKGDFDSKIIINTASQSAACGYDNLKTFKPGDIWVIYASQNFRTGHLSLNKKYDSLEEATKAMDQLAKITKKCSDKYQPVCGQYQHACCNSITADDSCKYKKVSCKAQEKTFSNLCKLEQSAGKFLYKGECKNTKPKVQHPSVNITPNQIISSPLKINGSSEGVWQGFEGQIGWVELQDANGNILDAQSMWVGEGWMTNKPVDFSATFEFENPKTKTGKLVFEKENPSGLPENDQSFEIPVKFKITSNSNPNPQTQNHNQPQLHHQPQIQPPKPTFWQNILNSILNFFSNIF